MDLGIAGRTAIVCGASAGLGRGVAEALAADGVNLLLAARTEERLPLLGGKPTQMFWGMTDPVFDGVVLDHLVELMPQAEVHRYADAGHYVLEDATDRIVSLVVPFLKP